MNILYLSRWFPYPPDNGARIRTFNLLQQLAQSHTVDLIAFHDQAPAPEQIAALQIFCRKVETVTYRPFKPSRPKAILGFFSTRPRSVLDTENEEMHASVAQATGQTKYDLVIAAEVDMIPYSLRVNSARLLEEIELATLYEQALHEANPIRRIRRMFMWKKWVHYLDEIAPAFRGATVVSLNERLLFARTLGKVDLPLAIIPNGVDAAHYIGDFGAPLPNTLIYTGAVTYQANLDAVNHFIQEIFPKIREDQPQACFTVTGKTDGVPLNGLAGRPGVHFTGYLPDIRPTLAQSWINVVPLRHGGGTRLKILESLAIGTPVVATPKGIEGLDLKPGADFLLAHTTDQFAAAAVHLFNDPALRQRLSTQGRQSVAAQYDWKAIGNVLNDFIQEVV